MLLSFWHFQFLKNLASSPGVSPWGDGRRGGGVGGEGLETKLITCFTLTIICVPLKVVWD